MKELNPHGYATSPEIAQNLAILLDRINHVRAEIGKPMTVTSGLRNVVDQARINPSAPHSKHLTGQAVDIADADRTLRAWVLANLPLMEKIGLWIEDFGHTPTWCHFQVVPPKSGKRIFIP